MKKNNIIIILTVLSILVITGCTETNNLNVCGDNVCSLTEDCNSCIEDCDCAKREYCSSEGLCRLPVCGDEICTDEEKFSNSCCIDCGCSENEVCSKVTQECVSKVEVQNLDDIVSKYLEENNVEGTTKKITDTYREGDAVKEVIISCNNEDLPYPCEIILLIDSNGKIIEEIKTT